MATKVTFTLDEQTIRRLESAAERLRKPKSEIVREAIGEYHERIGRLSEAEKQRLLRVIRDLAPTVPRRRPGEVEREIEEVRTARRSGGRRGSR
jgi:predicted DNA-binding protein